MKKYLIIVASLILTLFAFSLLTQAQTPAPAPVPFPIEAKFAGKVLSAPDINGSFQAKVVAVYYPSDSNATTTIVPSQNVIVNAQGALYPKGGSVVLTGVKTNWLFNAEGDATGFDSGARAIIFNAETIQFYEAGKANPQCVAQAAADRDGKIIDDFRIYYMAIENALLNRQNSLNTIATGIAEDRLSLEDAKGQIKIATVAYRDAVKGKKAAFIRAKKAAWLAFGNVRKQCRLNAAAAGDIAPNTDAE